MGQQGKTRSRANLRAVELISEAFERSGLSQQQLAEATGIPRSTIANFKSAPPLISAELLIVFALALRADPHEWIDEIEHVIDPLVDPSDTDVTELP